MKKEKKKKTFSKITSIILFLLLVILFVMLFMFNIISPIYILIALCIILLIYLYLLKICFSKKRRRRYFGNILNIIFCVLISFILVYLGNTLELFNNISQTEEKIETYNVLVLANSKYDDIKDLNNKVMGNKDDFNNPGLKEMKKQISKLIKIKYKKYDDILDVTNNIINKKVDSIVLENAELSILKEENSDIYNKLKIIYTKEIKVKIKDVAKSKNILKQPFNIYVSGVDTFGEITSATRSDVNILMSVNPVNNKMHITWVPRDYFVHINNSTYKDKLTHAGIYGINSSVYAVENLLKTDVNYYVKVNFTSIIKIVDVLGGITVYNDESFTSQDGYYYRKGEIKLDGVHALSFVRERKNVTGGDLGRGKNQIKVLEALITKVKTPKIITKYMSLLNSLDGSFVTNIKVKDITKFVDKEFKNKSDYEMTSYTLDGIPAFDYTYSYKRSKLSVMYPDDKSLENGKSQIKSALSVEN